MTTADKDLYQAALSGDIDEVRRCLAVGADVIALLAAADLNAADKHGHRPLSYAIGRCRPAHAGALLDAGAQLLVADWQLLSRLYADVLRWPPYGKIRKRLLETLLRPKDDDHAKALALSVYNTHVDDDWGIH